MPTIPRRPLGVVLSAGLLALAGCELRYTETGDLPALRERGRIRILVPRQPRTARLPRAGHPIHFDRDLATEFAEALGLEARIIRVRRRDDLIPALLDGRGDLVAAALTVTPDREERIAFSTPINFVQELVVTRIDDTTLAGPEDLDGRTIHLRPSSAYWATAQALRQDHPGIVIESVSEEMETEEILFRVSTGEFDVTLADDLLVDQALGYMPNLRSAFAVSDGRAIAWGMRPDASRLQAVVDSFLEAEDVLFQRRPQRYTGGLDAVRERGVLRLITRNNAASYFVWRGELVGFEYDLARRFADRLGVRLEVIVPPTRANMLPWLRQGYGDVIGASLTPTPLREAGDVAFSRPYNWVIQTVVARVDEHDLAAPEDLAGRTVVVRRRSTYWETAQDLIRQGIDVELATVPESLETEEIIGLVADGEYDLTIADSDLLAIELAWRDDVRGAFTLGDSVPHAWAVRAEDADLLDEVNRFLRAEYRGLWFNITYNKYFKTAHRVEERAAGRVSRTGQISPFDSLFRAYGDELGFDWRLLAAQAYAESRFDPEAESVVGAVGIMQVMPRTAEALGVDDPTDPAAGIRAGVRYLRQQYELFDDVATERDRLWFALASYNAGYGHVSDGRRLARRLGHDPDRWFGEVERVLPLLARREYHGSARFGYCRCTEPVRYVRRIRETWDAYREALAAAIPG
ncbi:MAG: transporter substrate-binding domain-containing protein [Gemmatimonadales bacterium]|jgi:membrane-bound lytic murein transglycosylase F